MVKISNLISLLVGFSGFIGVNSSQFVGLRGRPNLYPDSNKNIEVPKFNLRQMQDNKFTERESCCIICPDGLTKYYSVSTWFGNCGETCIDPDDYDIYKIFEPGLSIATTNTICDDLGYSLYTKTEKHGVWPITISVDMYKKPIGTSFKGNDDDGNRPHYYHDNTGSGDGVGPRPGSPFLRLRGVPSLTGSQSSMYNVNADNYQLSGDCPSLTVTCEYLPGLFQCCPSGESCIPNVGCRC